jgi:serine/threonine-protein kinase
MGLIHRDIKPANIMICDRGGVADLVKLLDFRLVRRTGAHGDILVTSPGLLTGTPAYMSPEQAGGDALDARSDIYSLGAVAYYLLAGEPPFVRRTSMQVLMAHVRDTPRPPAERRPDVPADLEAIVLRCLAKDPAARFSSIDSLDAALAATAAASQWTELDARQWWRSERPRTRTLVAGMQWP